ncbi:MAG: metallophosphoesterase [Phycisphaerae bacterium]|nr:metallophosphoesterase [Phycisphaerae bacterium]
MDRPARNATSSAFTRRSLLRAGGLAALASWFGMGGAVSGGVPAAGRGVPGPHASGRRVLRFAHLTDLHIQPEKAAAEGVAQCLRHLGTHGAPVDLVVTGGDLIRDSFKADEARTKLQWELLTKSLRDHAPCPIAHVLGNHDIWGWNKTKSKTTGTERLWGKAWALEQLSLSKPCHAFDRAGWHFICLDSVQPTSDEDYIGYLDDAQMDWLKTNLNATPKTTPIVVTSHIPIFSASSILDTNPEKPLTAVHRSIHRDAAALHKMFREHGNVRLALSGHKHRNDRTEFDGITYICDGAVSGSWWNGRQEHCDEGYGLIDLHDDGTFTHQYVTYGWKARA